MTGLSTAMDAVTSIMSFITSDTALAALAIGFPAVRAATRAFKRLAHIG